MKPCIGVVIGTRPEVIKMVPVIERLRAAGWCSVVLLPSGQHGPFLRDTMVECGLEVLDVLPIPLVPDGDPLALVAILAGRLRQMMAGSRLDLALVHGDTATALAAARAASELGIMVGHVEAGLRTHDLANPFPEEFHRREIARLAGVHFAPTPAAVANLRSEGVAPEAVVMTGNTIVDAMRRFGQSREPARPNDQIAVATLHRRELLPFLGDVLAGLARSLERHMGLRMVVPLHPNPKVARPLLAAFGTHPRVRLVRPLPHSGFLELLRTAALAITDSGGVQEEAAILGVPLVVIRTVTERPEVLQGGRAVVTGFDPAAICDGIAWALALPSGSADRDLFGDGRASSRVEQTLRQILCPAGDFGRTTGVRERVAS